MPFRKYRWSKDYEAAEEELELLLESLAGTAERHIMAAYETTPETHHDYPRRLWCAEGSLQFQIEGQAVSLQAGDALDILSQTSYSSTAGISGCVYYEARL